MRTSACVLLAGLSLALSGCPRRAPSPAPLPPPPSAPAAAAGSAYADWYPDDISLPAGVDYPCALTALPRSLEGVRAEERQYLNHLCAVALGVIRDKQVLLTALVNQRSTAEEHATYKATAADALARLRAEPVPAGLEAPHADLIGAIELHLVYFDRAVQQAAAGASLEALQAIPEGRTASGLLVRAWGAIEAHFAGWSQEVRDSAYHHLCALDLF